MLKLPLKLCLGNLLFIKEDRHLACKKYHCSEIHFRLLRHEPWNGSISPCDLAYFKPPKTLQSENATKLLHHRITYSYTCWCWSHTSNYIILTSVLPSPHVQECLEASQLFSKYCNNLNFWRKKRTFMIQMISNVGIYQCQPPPPPHPQVESLGFRFFFSLMPRYPPRERMTYPTKWDIQEKRTSTQKCRLRWDKLEGSWHTNSKIWRIIPWLASG